MRTLAIVVIALFLLIGIGGLSDPAQSAYAAHKPRDDLGSAFVELAASITALFVALDDATYAVDAAAHNGPRVAQACSGLLKCVEAVLAFVGVLALASVRRAFRRFLP
ncbi:MAG: hypothetical protein M1546_00730 [Chloroflexi bacterium]|nr:hypothetical protein [Chloroflexota bacterium]